jgi:hypothetical protein
VPVRLRAEINGRLPDLVETGAYYVLGEALADAVKHANVTLADISIGQRRQFLALAVRDDGEGAVPNGPGLAGLAGRIDALAGTMQLLGPPGRGTRLLVSLPTGTAPPWQRAVVAGHKNKDLPDDPAILDRAGAGSLAGALGPADFLLLELLPGAGGRVLALRAGGL